MRIVAALGGNALLRRSESAEIEAQRHNVEIAVQAIAELAGDHELVVTHGNGPQVGLLSLQAESSEEVAPYPLDVLGAESEGMIGYLLEQQLGNTLPGRHVATLLTQVVVNGDDPAFSEPTKPIGPVYGRAAAERLAEDRDWTIAPDGDGFRRVVPSPEPQALVEISTIRLLIESGVLVVCVGGGGIPVVCESDGRLRGVEAVIDKDLAAAVLAREIDADSLLLLTDVDAVYRDWGAERASPIGEAPARELRSLALPAGSMRPKVEAACRFREETGGLAAIGALADAPRVLRGERGTRVAPA
jgi:carbamate kinase